MAKGPAKYKLWLFFVLRERGGWQAEEGDGFLVYGKANPEGVGFNEGFGVAVA